MDDGLHFDSYHHNGTDHNHSNDPHDPIIMSNKTAESLNMNNQTADQDINNKLIERRPDQERAGNIQQLHSTTTSKTINTPIPNPNQTSTNSNMPNYTPHKKYGVILEAIGGLTIEQYLRAIADNIGGINIKYASRLGGGRICVYLATEQHVQEICASGGITINNTYIQCRPYIMAAKRVVLSNVLPDIPNATLLPLLNTFGKPTSPISNLPIATTHPDLKHIKSFRRLVYMVIPSMDKIPPTLNLEHEEAHYTIYVTCDDVTCTKCHKPGHSAQNCHTTAQSRLSTLTFADLAAGRRVRPPPPQSHSTTTKELIQDAEVPVKDDITIFPVLSPARRRLPSKRDTNSESKIQRQQKITTNEEGQCKQIPQNINKQQQPTEHYNAVETSTTELTPLIAPPTPPEVQGIQSTCHDKQLQNTQRTPDLMELDHKDTEALQSDDSEEMQEMTRNKTSTNTRDRTTIADHKAIDSLCESLREQGNQPVSITTFAHFLKACRRQKDPKVIAKEHTTNIGGLISMLEDNLGNTKDYNLRRRMKRIVDSLQ
jgi:hypothetical protein